MIRLLALLSLWTLPWRLSALGFVAQLDVAVGCEEYADLAGVCGGYYDDRGESRAIVACEHECLYTELNAIILHESQHHMQLKYRISRRSGGYSSFREAVVHEIQRPVYEEEVREAVYALIKQDRSSGSRAYNELHAHLPVLLEMNIPPSLQPWYPWFRWPDPKDDSRIATSQEDTSWSVGRGDRHSMADVVVVPVTQ